MRCIKCGEKAFSSPLFFMRHAKCKNCGFAKLDR
jgi:ribosomal protein L37E